MTEALKIVLALLSKKGAEYADCRHERAVSESIQVRNGEIEGFSSGVSEGVGIRVLYKGAWGFAASNLLSDTALTATADRALAVAAAFSSVNPHKVRLHPVEPCVASYSTPFAIDPFEVPPEEKLGLLIGVTTAALGHKDIAVAEAFMEFEKTDKLFVSTEGAEITQRIMTSGGGYHVIAERGHETQTRSYPDAHHGLYSTTGYELFDELDMAGSVERVATEASSLLSAPECRAGETDLIIDGPQMALQIHESCGHPVELDRVLGSEISFAGASFLTPDKLGHFRYGSKHVNLYADPTHEKGAGSYCFDDEGTRAERVELVREGVFSGYLNSRESAAAAGGRPNGSMRAEGWHGSPIVRMSNICIEPGQASLDELIADTKNGVLMSTNRSWSIDDLRLNFQFGAEIAWEIKNGRRGRVLKNPLYYGVTPRFWASCDGVCNRDHWRIWGLNSCAKGQPVQTANVGHGASPARFRNVSIGVLKEGMNDT